MKTISFLVFFFFWNPRWDEPETATMSRVSRVMMLALKISTRGQYAFPTFQSRDLIKYFWNNQFVIYPEKKNVTNWATFITSNWTSYFLLVTVTVLALFYPFKKENLQNLKYYVRLNIESVIVVQCSGTELLSRCW